MLRIHVQVNEAGAWVCIHMLKRLKARSFRFLGKRFYSDPFTVGTIETPIHLQFSRCTSMRTFHGHLLIGLFRPLAKRLAFDFWWGFSHLCPVCPYVKVGSRTFQSFRTLDKCHLAAGLLCGVENSEMSQKNLF